MNWRHSRASVPNPAALALETTPTTGARSCSSSATTTTFAGPSSEFSSSVGLLGGTPQHSFVNLRISGTTSDGRDGGTLSSSFGVRPGSCFVQSTSPSVVNVPRQAIWCRVVEPKPSSATPPVVGYYSSGSPFTSVVCSYENGSDDPSQLVPQPQPQLQPRPTAFLINNLSCEKPTFSTSCESSALLSSAGISSLLPNPPGSSSTVPPSVTHPYADFVSKPYQQQRSNNLLFLEKVSPPPTPSSGALLAKQNTESQLPQPFCEVDYSRLAQGRSSASSANMGSDRRCSAPHALGVDPSKAQLVIPVPQNKGRAEMRSMADTRRRSQESLLLAPQLPPVKPAGSASLLRGAGVGFGIGVNGSNSSSGESNGNATSISCSVETSKSPAEDTTASAHALSAEVSSLDEATMEMSSKCDHVTYWKRLRSKRGFAHYLCTLCEARWQVPTQLSKTFLRSLNNKNSIQVHPAIPSEPTTPPRIEATPATSTSLLTTTTTSNTTAAFSPLSHSPSPSTELITSSTELITVNPAMNITPLYQQQQHQPSLEALNPHSDSHLFRSQSTSSQLTAAADGGGVGSSVGCASTELTPASWGFMAGKSMSALSIGCSSSASSSFTCGTSSCSSSIPRTVIPSCGTLPPVTAVIEAVGVERSPVLSAAVAGFTPYSPFTCAGFSLFLPSPAGGTKEDVSSK